jgi:hypothetical protein
MLDTIFLCITVSDYLIFLCLQASDFPFTLEFLSKKIYNNFQYH